MKSSEQKDSGPKTIITGKTGFEYDQCNLSNGWIAVILGSELHWNNGSGREYYSLVIYDPSNYQIIAKLELDTTSPRLLPLANGKLAMAAYGRGEYRGPRLDIWDPISKKMECIIERESQAEKIHMLCLMPDQNGILCEIGTYKNTKFMVLNPVTKEFSDYILKDPRREYRTGYLWKDSIVLIDEQGTITFIDPNKKTVTGPPLIRRYENELSSFDKRDLLETAKISHLDNLLMTRLMPYNDVSPFDPNWKPSPSLFQIWDLESKKPVNEFVREYKEGGTCAVLLPGNRIAFGGPENIQIFDIHSKKLLSTIQNKNNEVLYLSHDFNLLSSTPTELVSIDIGLRQEFKKEYDAYKQKIMEANLNFSSGVAGVVSEYLVMARDKLPKDENTSTPKFESSSLKSELPTAEQKSVTPQKAMDKVEQPKTQEIKEQKGDTQQHEKEHIRAARLKAMEKRGLLRDKTATEKAAAPPQSIPKKTK